MKLFDSRLFLIETQKDHEPALKKLKRHYAAPPDKHLEAIKSRPLLLHAVGKQTRHHGQTIVTITSTRAKSEKVQRILDEISCFLPILKTTAEQLTPNERCQRILSRAFFKLLGGKPLRRPNCYRYGVDKLL